MYIRVCNCCENKINNKSLNFNYVTGINQNNGCEITTHVDLCSECLAKMYSHYMEYLKKPYDKFAIEPHANHINIIGY